MFSPGHLPSVEGRLRSSRVLCAAPGRRARLAIPALANRLRESRPLAISTSPHHERRLSQGGAS